MLSLLSQFRQSVFGQLAGYEDINDADRGVWAGMNEKQRAMYLIAGFIVLLFLTFTLFPSPNRGHRPVDGQSVPVETPDHVDSEIKMNTF